MRPGDRLGEYLLRREIGAGGIAYVFIAEHATRGTEVVIKALRPELLTQPAVVDTFLREPRALQSVEHEGTLEVTEVHEEGPQPYFVTDLLRGRTLAEVLRQGPLPLPRAVHIARQVATVLAHAHDVDVVHRNVKPNNVFLVQDGSRRDVVKLLELGATRMQIEGEKPVPGTVIGTPAYMAPEQFRQIAGDHRVDLYAFGVLLFELVVGRRPFIGEVPELIRQHLLVEPPRALSLAPHTPAALDELIASCLQKEPLARPPSMHEVLLSLATLAETLPAPVFFSDGPEPSVAVPKNTSGYSAIALDATKAPTPELTDHDEPSFETVTGETRRPQLTPVAVAAKGEQQVPAPVSLPGALRGDPPGEPPAPFVPNNEITQVSAVLPDFGPETPAPATPQPSLPPSSPGAFDIEHTDHVERARRPTEKSNRALWIAGAATVLVLVLGFALTRGGSDDAASQRDPPTVRDAGAVATTPPPAIDPPPQQEPPVEPAPGGAQAQDTKAPGEDTLVDFASSPSGAQVWIRMDRRIRMLCTTPCTFKLPVGKPILVELRLEGYKSAQRSLTVTDNERVRGTLTPQ